MVTPRPSSLRKIFEEQFSVLAREVEASFQSELAAREAGNRESARRELAEEMNQALRRLRFAGDFRQVSAIVADSSASLCSCLAVFSITDATVRGELVRGLDAAAERFRALEFPLARAAAFGSALESGDPVVALSTPREVSTEVSELFGHKPDGRVCILPILVHQKPVGVLYAPGPVDMAPLELLAQAAALALEARAMKAAPAPAGLVSIQPDKTAESAKRNIPGKWEELAPEDQQIHLRAQRFARVQVAGMRLFSAESVQDGRTRKDLYGALQSDIDAGREMFRQSFLSATPTMVDYFHLELLGTLANDDSSLLGEKYPGPLV